MADRKTRAWGFILYPEDNEDLELVIESMHLPVILSPLHDSDMWTELDQAKDALHVSGTLKAPHWHGMVMFDGPVRASQALSAVSAFSNPPKYVEPLSSVTGYARYMLHMDNPEKAQYSREDLGFYNGASVSLERPLTPEEFELQTSEILHYVDENNITEYSELVMYAMYSRPDWNQNVRNHTLFWRTFMSSRRGIICASLSKESSDNS